MSSYVGYTRMEAHHTHLKISPYAYGLSNLHKLFFVYDFTIITIDEFEFVILEVRYLHTMSS
jgi:hypothetical protein